MPFSNDANFKDADSSFSTGNFNDHDTQLHGPSSDAVDIIGSRSNGDLLPVNGNSNHCACILCNIKEECKGYRRKEKRNCSFGCTANVAYTSNWRKHYKTHFKQDNGYLCKAPHCSQVFPRWGELTRHTKGHCLRPTRFPCDVFGCPYGGDNGFVRKDKLYSHKRNVHDGKLPPSQLMRKLQPKPKV